MNGSGLRAAPLLKPFLVAKRTLKTTILCVKRADFLLFSRTTASPRSKMQKAHFAKNKFRRKERLVTSRLHIFRFTWIVRNGDRRNITDEAKNKSFSFLKRWEALVDTI